MSTPKGDERDPVADRAGLAWQTGVWDQISQIYLQEIDKRFVPAVEQLVARAAQPLDEQRAGFVGGLGTRVRHREHGDLERLELPGVVYRHGGAAREIGATVRSWVMRNASSRPA